MNETTQNRLQVLLLPDAGNRSVAEVVRFFRDHPRVSRDGVKGNPVSHLSHVLQQQEHVRGILSSILPCVLDEVCLCRLC